MTEGEGTERSPVARDLVVLLGVVLGLLALFANKAFTIDDTLFLWLGRQILDRPLDFFGFDVNWYGTVMPMHEVTKNPPLAGYFLAAAASLLGWTEPALHLAFLLPAAFAASGTYFLARRFCRRPLVASMIGLLTPAFLVSSTNVMCDTMMLAFFCWAFVLWGRGIDSGSWLALAAAAVLAALAFLTKYFGIAVVPLMAVHGAMHRRRIGVWALPLLVPLAALVAYELATHSLYGKALFLDAMHFAGQSDGLARPDIAGRFVVGLVFAGGCLATVLFFAPILYARTGRFVLGAAFAGTLVLALVAGALPGIAPLPTENFALSFWMQAIAMAVGGGVVLHLCFEELRRNRDADAAVLSLWMIGTFVFAAFLNWVNNGRSNLPMAAVIGILVVRRLDAMKNEAVAPGRFAARAALALGLVVGAATALSDTLWANSVRDVARGLASRHRASGAPIRFQGHWGFQWYMQAEGAEAIDLSGERLYEGDLVVVPVNNTQIVPLTTDFAEIVEIVRRPEPAFLRTMSNASNAGFYSSASGVLPYRVGICAPDVYAVMRVLSDRRLVLRNGFR